MSSYIEVYAIVEGKTEQIFIEEILAPYLGAREIGIHATQVSKKGQKSGDVHFSRVKNDLGLHLKQRCNTYVTTFIDYYATKEWPGFERLSPNFRPAQTAQVINDATKKEVVSLFSEQKADRRFIPFVAVHEFEALLFSDIQILAEQLKIDESKIAKVISKCGGSPEAINNHPLTAPSKYRVKLCEFS